MDREDFEKEINRLEAQSKLKALEYPHQKNLLIYDNPKIPKIFLSFIKEVGNHFKKIEGIIFIFEKFQFRKNKDEKLVIHGMTIRGKKQKTPVVFIRYSCLKKKRLFSAFWNEMYHINNNMGEAFPPSKVLVNV